MSVGKVLSGRGRPGRSGTAHVEGGAGDPGGGCRRVRSAVPDSILATIGDGAARINVGKQASFHPVPQEEINDMLVRLGRAGRTVVRLKGGDPFIFGRGCEEAAELERAGIPYEVIPGITAAQGCAAAARIPLTHRGLATRRALRHRSSQSE